MCNFNAECQTKPLTMRSTYFKNLDALRFFSFFSVFLSHTLLLAGTGNSFTEVLINVVLMNYLGVPFFFSLSSFLITYRLLIEREKKGNIRLFNFYKNRILRIWPAYFIILIICFVMLPLAASVLHSKAPTLPHFLPFIFFYVNFYIIENGESFTFALAILWSISIEEQFYFIWGIIMKFISGKIIGILISLLFFLSIVFSYYYLSIHPGASNNLAIHSLFILQNFCAGALAAFLFFQKSVFVLPNAVKQFAYIIPYFILPLCYLFTKDFIVFNIIKSFCYGAILYDQSFNEERLFNSGKSAIINYLGEISYGLYLYHAVIIVLLQTQFHFFDAAVHPSVLQNILQDIIALSITIFISHLSYKYIESKFLALKSV